MKSDCASLIDEESFVFKDVDNSEDKQLRISTDQKGSRSACLTCDYGLQYIFSITMTHLCSNALSVRETIPSPYLFTIDFSDTAEFRELTTGPKIFNNARPESCPLTKCTIFSKGCLVPAKTTRVFIETEHPFLVTAQSDAKLGYRVEGCIEC